MKIFMEKEKQEIEEGILFAESIYGFRTRKPIVKISYGITFETQMSPEEARQFAHSIFEAAEAAETDAFLMEWLEKRIGIDTDEGKVAVLADFRKWHENFRNGEEVEDRPNGK